LWYSHTVTSQHCDAGNCVGECASPSAMGFGHAVVRNVGPIPRKNEAERYD